MNSYNGFSPEQREKAQRWLRSQWESGALARPSTCCACGQTRGIIHAHAEDYSEPFGDQTHAYHLCYRCHICLHCRFRYPAGWEAYKVSLRQGAIWAPIFRADFNEIVKTLSGTALPVSKGLLRSRLVFDDFGA